MDESQKRMVVIVVAVLAVIVASYSAYRALTADQLQAGVQHASPAKSMKQMEMERQAKEDAALKLGGTASPSPDRNLSGAPSGPPGKGD